VPRDETITPAHIAALVDFYVGSMTGSENLSGIGNLGPFSRLLIDENGWTGAGLAKSRQHIGRMLRIYASRETKKPEGGVTTKRVAESLAKHWGLTEYPVGLGVVFDEFPKGTDESFPARKTMYDWPRRVQSSGAVLSWLNYEWLPNTPATFARLPSGPRPRWGGSKEAWPPETVNGSAIYEGEREELVVAALATAGISGLDGKDTINVLREVVAEHLLSNYFARASSSQMYRHLLHRLAAPWASGDALALSEFSRDVEEKPADSGHYTHTAAVATQLFFHDAALGLSPGIADRLREVAQARFGALAMRELATENSLNVLGAIMRTVADDAIQRFIFRTTKSTTLEDIVLVGAIEKSHDTHLAASLYKTAIELRNARSAREKHDYGEKYMRDRRTVDWAKVGDADAVLLELADQSAQLDFVYQRMHNLAEELGELIRDTASTGRGLAYRALVHRNESLVHAQQSRFGSGVNSIVRGLESVRHLEREGVLDAKAARETAHQLALAGAGVYLRIIENLYRDPRTTVPDARVEESVRNALFLSSQTLERLGELEDCGLAANRHDDNYISSVSWRVQSRIIRLRVQLASRTAILAKICPPLTSKTPLGRTLDCDIPHLIQSYLDLIETPELTAANEVVVVQLAMWLAFLNGGRVPVAEALSPGLKMLRFLDADPSRLSPGGSATRVMDIRAASEFLLTMKSNAGILSGIREKGHVASVLLEHSGGAFAEWREQYPDLSSSYDASTSD